MANKLDKPSDYDGQALFKAVQDLIHTIKDIPEQPCRELLSLLRGIEGSYRQIEQGLHEWRDAVDALRDPIFLYDSEHRIVRANKAYARHAGFNIEDIIGKRYWEVFPKGNGPLAEASCDGGKCLEVTLDSGEVFLSRSFVVRCQNGHYLYSVHILEDITKRKNAEVELHDTGRRLSLSLHLLESIVESVPIRIFWKDRDLNYLGCNTLFAKDAGLLCSDDLIGKSDFDMGWREQAEIYREDDKQVMDSGVPKLNYEEPQTTPDGNRIWLRTSKVPLRNDAQEVIGILGIYDDITEWKQAEERVLLSESRLKEAQAVAHLGSWELDLVKNELWWSDENYRVFGIEPGGRHTYETFLDRVYPEDLDFVNNAYTGSIENRTPYDIEHRLLMEDGSVKWVHERCETHYDDSGRPVRSAGTTLDITERKRAEAQVARLGRLLDSSIHEIYVFNAADLKFVQANASARRNLGYAMEELLAMTPLDVKPEFTQDQFEALLKPLRENKCQVQVFETLQRRKDGGDYPVEVHLQFSSNESPPVFFSNILDISERKMANERLRYSEAGLAEAQRIAQLGNWELDLISNELTWSDEIYRIFEIDQNQFGVSYEAFLNAVHPDDRAYVDRVYRRSVEDRTSYNIIHRLLMSDGRVKYVREMCETDYDERGTPLRSLGTAQDVTEQHLAEKSLQRSNRALRALTTCNSILIHADNKEQLLTDMCRAIIDGGGYRFVWIGQVEGEEPDFHLRPLAHAGFENGYLSGASVNCCDKHRVHGATERAICSGTPQVTQDISREPDDLLWHKEALARGYASCIAVPLKNAKKEVFAVLSIFSVEPNAFDQNEIDLLTEMAGDIAFGLLTVETRNERDRYHRQHLQSAEQLKEALVGAIRAIALTVEKRDPYTAGHQSRVAQLAVAIAGELKLDSDCIEGIKLGALIHDIGKIYVPAEILNRPGRLTAAEFEIIKSHCEVGYDIIKDVKFPWPVADIIYQHHERLDGSGYPRGLAGDEIILQARILAVADVVEAVTAHRPYRPAMGIEKALTELETNRGRYYDPEVTDVCLRLIREKGFVFTEAGIS